ncbi:MAG TPA: hypothetical protein VLT32_00150 [Candidatus Sulfomarinibacteraceae bacterium]|nr:hypothetical protein [Candidatus Sulfomarinibacteraceae bacterium]
MGIIVIGGAGCGAGGAPEIGSSLPVRDGTYFRYADETSRSSNFPETTMVRFEDTGEGTFRYIETFRVEARARPESSEENPAPINIVREDGIILRFAEEALKPSALGKEQVINRSVKIWLAPENRAPGAEVRLAGFPGTAEVGERRSWKRWKVLVVAPFGYEYYYDENTGFLVGWLSAGGDTWVLDGSNAPGLGGV